MFKTNAFFALAFAALSLPAIASEDRAIGSLMGLAVGDAMGVTQEMIPRLESDPEEMHKNVLKQRKLRAFRGLQTKMEGIGPFVPSLKLKAGEFTDDTSMALCLADSIIAKGTLDPLDLMKRFERWASEGYNASRYETQDGKKVGIPFGLGGNTRAALSRFSKDKTNPFVGGQNEERDAGNGSIMRLAPVAIYWHKNIQQAALMARLQSSVTHNVSEALEGAEFLAEIIVRAIAGEAKEKIFVSKLPFKNPLIAKLAEENALWKKKVKDEIRTLPGRASLSLEAAMWCIHNTNTFKDAVILAVSLGGDADTIAAITGQIAGALYGEKMIPREWIETLAFHDKIRLKAHALYHHLPDSPDFAINAEK